MNVIVDRRMVRSHTEKLEMTCAECGQIAEEAVVRLGTFMENRGYEWSAEPFCLLCLKRAVAEAEAAVARDKGRPWDPIARVLNLAAELAEGGDEWAITTAIERLGGSKGDICMLINDRFGAAYNRATPQERAPMLRELAAAGPKEKP